MELHPLATLFPRIEKYEFECLKLDIKENGQREPIIVHDGMILDGSHRYQVCVSLGIEPIIKQFTGESIVSFVLSANLHRRHLTPGQQAAIVSCVQDWAKAHTHGGNRVSSGNVTACSVKDRRAISGASDKTQRNADKLSKESPELAKQVAKGEKTLPQAIKEISPPKPEQEPQVDEKDLLIDALNSEIDSVYEENELLKNRLAADSMPEEDRVEQFNRLNELLEENKKLKAMNSALIKSRDSVMTENVSLKKQCQIYLKKLKALEK